MIQAYDRPAFTPTTSGAASIRAAAGRGASQYSHVSPRAISPSTVAPTVLLFFTRIDRAYRPEKVGSRFSTKARMPSRASAVAEQMFWANVSNSSED
jgi:hypothetical protein